MTLQIPPVAMRLQHSSWPTIWLPLFLLWPLILAVFCLALPVCVIASPAPARAALALLAASYRMLCALSGTHLELEEAQHGTWVVSLY